MSTVGKALCQVGRRAGVVQTHKDKLRQMMLSMQCCRQLQKGQLQRGWQGSTPASSLLPGELGSAWAQLEPTEAPWGASTPGSEAPHAELGETLDWHSPDACQPSAS